MLVRNEGRVNEDGDRERLNKGANWLTYIHHLPLHSTDPTCVVCGHVDWWEGTEGGFMKRKMTVEGDSQIN